MVAGRFAAWLLDDLPHGCWTFRRMVAGRFAAT
jgi:hypothetical protein